MIDDNSTKIETCSECFNQYTPNTQSEIDFDPYMVNGKIICGGCYDTKYKPKWRCEECGYEDRTPHPVNREKFYSRRQPRVCPSCHSEAMMPVGF